MFLAAAARIRQFVIRTVADGRKISRVEEGSVISQLGPLVAIQKSAGFAAHFKGHVYRIARTKWLFSGNDDVEISRAGGDDVEWSIEHDVLNGLLRVGDVDLRNRLGRLVLEHEVTGA